MKEWIVKEKFNGRTDSEGEGRMDSEGEVCWKNGF